MTRVKSACFRGRMPGTSEWKTPFLPTVRDPGVGPVLLFELTSAPLI